MFFPQLRSSVIVPALPPMGWPCIYWKVLMRNAELRVWGVSVLVRLERGFLRLSCAQPDDRLSEAVAFISVAISFGDRIGDYLELHPEYRLSQLYEAGGSNP